MEVKGKVATMSLAVGQQCLLVTLSVFEVAGRRVERWVCN